MFDRMFLDKLIKKYNYDSKTINALSKIIPNLIEYYGNEHEEVILNAIYNCEIVPCNSYQTISKIKNEKSKGKTKIQKNYSLKDINLKNSESTYLSNVILSYDEITNTFNIDDVSRIVVTAHTFNYDSPKGLEVLTYALCKLIKSYYNEYKVIENKLIRQTGILKEKMQILKDKEEIYLIKEEESGVGLEEGLTIYDTKQIVSMILKDTYECHDYDSVYKVAEVLKGRFNLLDKINEIEITKFDKGDEFEDLTQKIKVICDECFSLEHDMFLSMTRDEKNNLAKQINNRLIKDTFISSLMNVYEKSKKKTIKN